MIRRGGFTLLELVVAIVVGAVVSLLAYATLRAGIDTRERVERTSGTVSAEAVARSMLVDALRHLPEGGGAAMDEPLFTLEDRTGAGGLPADVVTFVSYGVGRAPGTSGAWSITVGPAEDGVTVRAAPLDPAEGAPFDLRLPDARGLDARVLARGSDAEWSDAWDLPGRVPAAVELRFVDDAGHPSGPPLLVQAALEGLP